MGNEDYLLGKSSICFSSMAIKVGRAAMSMIEEARRQFRDIPELKAALAVLNKGNESDWLKKIKHLRSRS